MSAKNDTTMEFSKNITLWIKENIGTKLEHVDRRIAQEVEAALSKKARPVPLAPQSVS